MVVVNAESSWMPHEISNLRLAGSPDTALSYRFDLETFDIATSPLARVTDGESQYFIKPVGAGEAEMLARGAAVDLGPGAIIRFARSCDISQGGLHNDLQQYYSDIGDKRLILLEKVPFVKDTMHPLTEPESQEALNAAVEDRLRGKPITATEQKQILAELRHLAEQGVIHGDLSANISIQRDEKGKLSIFVIDPWPEKARTVNGIDVSAYDINEFHKLLQDMQRNGAAEAVTLKVPKTIARTPSEPIPSDFPRIGARQNDLAARTFRASRPSGEQRAKPVAIVALDGNPNDASSFASRIGKALSDKYTVVYAQESERGSRAIVASDHRLQSLLRTTSDVGLVITDENMAGGISGIEIASNLYKSNPNVHAYVVTGSDKRQTALASGLSAYVHADHAQIVQDALSLVDENGHVKSRMGLALPSDLTPAQKKLATSLYTALVNDEAALKNALPDSRWEKLKDFRSSPAARKQLDQLLSFDIVRHVKGLNSTLMKKHVLPQLQAQLNAQETANQAEHSTRPITIEDARKHWREIERRVRDGDDTQEMADEFRARIKDKYGWDVAITEAEDEARRLVEGANRDERSVRARNPDSLAPGLGKPDESPSLTEGEPRGSHLPEGMRASVGPDGLLIDLSNRQIRSIHWWTKEQLPDGTMAEREEYLRTARKEFRVLGAGDFAPDRETALHTEYRQFVSEAYARYEQRVSQSIIELHAGQYAPQLAAFLAEKYPGNRELVACSSPETIAAMSNEGPKGPMRTAFAKMVQQASEFQGAEGRSKLIRDFHEAATGDSRCQADLETTTKSVLKLTKRPQGIVAEHIPVLEQALFHGSMPVELLQAGQRTVERFSDAVSHSRTDLQTHASRSSLITTDPFARRITPDAAREHLDKLYEAIPEGTSRAIVDTFLRKDGHIVIVNDTSTSAYHEGSLGFAAPAQNEIYLSRNQPLNSGVGTLVEEAMHMVIHRLYDNNCEPYHVVQGPTDVRGRRPNDARQDLLNEAFRVDLERLGPKGKETLMTDLGLVNYQGRDWHSEAVVKLEVLEATGMLTPEIAERYRELNRFRKEVIHKDVATYNEGKPLPVVDINHYREQAGYTVSPFGSARSYIANGALNIPVGESLDNPDAVRIRTRLERLGLQVKAIVGDAVPAHSGSADVPTGMPSHQAGYRLQIPLEDIERAVATRARALGELSQVTQLPSNFNHQMAEYSRTTGSGVALNAVGAYHGLGMLLHGNSAMSDSQRVTLGTAVVGTSAAGIAYDLQAGRLAESAVAATNRGAVFEAAVLGHRAETAKLTGVRIGLPLNMFMTGHDAVNAYTAFKRDGVTSFEGWTSSAGAASGAMMSASALLPTGSRLAALAGTGGVVTAIGVGVVHIGVTANEIVQTQAETQGTLQDLADAESRLYKPGMTAVYVSNLRKHAHTRPYNLPDPSTAEYRGLSASLPYLVNQTEHGKELKQFGQNPPPDRLLSHIETEIAALTRKRNEAIEQVYQSGYLKAQGGSVASQERSQRLQDEQREQIHKEFVEQSQTAAGRASLEGSARVLPGTFNQVNEYEHRLRLLEAAKQEVYGSRDGNINHDPTMPSYAKRCEDLRQCRTAAQQESQRLKPVIPSLQSQVKLAELAQMPERDRIDHIHRTLTDSLGTDDAVPETARAAYQSSQKRLRQAQAEMIQLEASEPELLAHNRALGKESWYKDQVSKEKSSLRALTLAAQAECGALIQQHGKAVTHSGFGLTRDAKYEEAKANVLRLDAELKAHPDDSIIYAELLNQRIAVAQMTGAHAARERQEIRRSLQALTADNEALASDPLYQQIRRGLPSNFDEQFIALDESRDEKAKSFLEAKEKYEDSRNNLVAKYGELDRLDPAKLDANAIQELSRLTEVEDRMLKAHVNALLAEREAIQRRHEAAFQSSQLRSTRIPGITLDDSGVQHVGESREMHERTNTNSASAASSPPSLTPGRSQTQPQPQFTLTPEVHAQVRSAISGLGADLIGQILNQESDATQSLPAGRSGRGR